jgi:hypothetical protein
MNLKRKYASCGRRGMPKDVADMIVWMYRESRSCSIVAEATGRTRQAVWDVLHRRGMTFPNPNRHAARRKTTIVYNGENFTPDKDRYYRSTQFHTRLPGGHRLLHRVIYEDHHGPVPKGRVVVFADRNDTNFSPENLLCMTLREMRKFHGFFENGYTKYAKRKAFLFEAYSRALADGDPDRILRTKAAYDALPPPNNGSAAHSRVSRRMWDRRPRAWRKKFFARVAAKRRENYDNAMTAILMGIDPSGLDDLCESERETIELLMEGRTREEIARYRGIKPRSVHAFVSRGFRKLGIPMPCGPEPKI